MTRSPQFNRLLGSILADWKFFAVEDLSSAKLLFVERGLALPAHDGQVVWLTPMPLVEGNYLTVPISLTELYHLLEARFFTTPRRHIRVAMEMAVDLKLENAWIEGCLTSLSDRGGRIMCAHEIPRGKLLDIEIKLAGRVLCLPSEVLYCIPGGDSSGRVQPQVGVLFRPSSDHELNLLRHYIEKICIDGACARENIPLTAPCVSWLDVPTNHEDVTAGFSLRRK